MPKKSEVLRFPRLSDPLCGNLCNKETYLADVMDFTHAGGNNWILVLSGINTKLMGYYRLGYKDFTTHSTLNELGKLVTKFGIPRQLIMDIYSILGAGNLWK